MTDQPAVMFHVAPSSARASITRHGIDRTRGTSPWVAAPVGFRPESFPAGNYLFADVDLARAYRGYAHDAGTVDVWQVATAGLDLSPDPLWERERRGVAFLAQHPVPPERVALHAAAGTPLCN